MDEVARVGDRAAKSGLKESHNFEFEHFAHYLSSIVGCGGVWRFDAVRCGRTAARCKWASCAQFIFKNTF